MASSTAMENKNDFSLNSLYNSSIRIVFKWQTKNSKCQDQVASFRKDHLAQLLGGTKPFFLRKTNEITCHQWIFFQNLLPCVPFDTFVVDRNRTLDLAAPKPIKSIGRFMQMLYGTTHMPFVSWLVQCLCCYNFQQKKNKQISNEIRKQLPFFCHT